MRNDTRDDGSPFAVWEASDAPSFADAATRAEFMYQVEGDPVRARSAKLAAMHLRDLLVAEHDRRAKEDAEYEARMKAALPPADTDVGDAPPSD